MLFNISDYNVGLAFYLFIFCISFLFFIFKRKISSFLDPLLYLLLWISANLSFLFLFSFKYGITEIWILFLMAFLSYSFLLLFSIDNIKKRELKAKNFIFYTFKNEQKLLLFYIISFILLIYSKKE